MTSLDLTVVTGLLAVSLSLVVLLTIFEKAMRRVVVSQVLRSLLIILPIVVHGTVARVQLLQDFAASL